MIDMIRKNINGLIKVNRSQITKIRLIMYTHTYSGFYL